MKNRQPYPFLPDSVPDESFYRYFFISKGVRSIKKLIQYEYQGTGNFLGISTQSFYNLAFGDSTATEELDDATISDNGDGLRVFATVLNSIPTFFEAQPKAALMVSGSDSGDEFFAKCRADTNKCVKHCTQYEQCDYADRRIGLYTRYVDANYQTLSQDYMFFGMLSPREQKPHHNPPFIEPYDVKRSSKYDVVLLRQK
jgi:hypothetical protein